MTTQRIGIIMHGVTGRMGMNQHLIRSVLAIRDRGGMLLKDGDRLVPDVIIVGRNEKKIAELAAKHGVVGLVKTLANELAPFSIRVNSVHPTAVDTDMIHNTATYSMFMPDKPSPTRADAAGQRRTR